MPYTESLKNRVTSFLSPSVAAALTSSITWFHSSHTLRMDMRSLVMVVSLAVLLLTAISSAELPRPNITRHQLFSSALTGLVAIGVNKSNTIWCSASHRVMGSKKLQMLLWAYTNRTLLPAVDRGQSSGHEVYMERYAGSSSEDNVMWRRVLHFKTTKPSSAGNYTCVANYKGNMNSHQSVEIRVSDIDCGDPGTPTNGIRHPFSTVYTSEVLYQCSMGYTLQGPDRRTCQSDGQWSGHLPQCNRKGTSPTTSGTSLTTSGTSNSNGTKQTVTKSTEETGSAAVIASVVVILLLLLGCVSVIVITVVVIYRRFRSRKSFSPTELYQSKMESFPLPPEKEVKFLGNVTTNGFSWPEDAVGQATQADKETEFGDSHSITEADGEVSVVAVADSTQLSDEAEHSDAVSDQLDEEAQPGSGCEAARAYEANNFVEYVKKMHIQRDRGFEEEFKKIVDDPNGVHDVAKANRSKNRYHNVHTFDHSRVVLSEVDEQGSDYINASYINGEHGDIYIASQGPTPETVSDFWLMIWDVRPAVIVMLTKVNENGRRKCEQYWNEQLDEPYDAGRGFTVVTTGYKGFADYVVRDMALTRSSDEHDRTFCLKQFQYTGWPDHGVPCQSSSLVKFIQQVRNEFEGTDAPIVIHCSAGVGRTGTYICLDAMMERLKKRDDLNIFECVSIFEFVSEMRTQRMKMVQTLDQYVFIHDALCDYITCGDTSVPAHELKGAIATFMRVNKNTEMTGFQEQFDMLEKLSKTPCPEDVAFAKKMVVAKRNRYKDRFPYFANYLRLPYSSASNGTDYFNASFMNSYSGRRAFIAAQSPMAQTRNDIWELIWQFRISTIVLLCELREENQDTCYPFWPDERMGTFDWKIVKVNYKTTVPMKGCDKVLLDVSNNSKLASPPMEAVLYHIRGWTTTGPPPAASLLGVMGEVAELQKEKVGPVLVMCDDGMSRSAVFITCMSEIERVKVEGGVDIFQTVKAARAQRPHMVYTSEQYKMCFEILQSYLELYDTYANYKGV